MRKNKVNHDFELGPVRLFLSDIKELIHIGGPESHLHDNEYSYDSLEELIEKNKKTIRCLSITSREVNIELGRSFFLPNKVWACDANRMLLVKDLLMRRRRLFNRLFPISFRVESLFVLTVPIIVNLSLYSLNSIRPYILITNVIAAFASCIFVLIPIFTNNSFLTRIHLFAERDSVTFWERYRQGIIGGIIGFILALIGTFIQKKLLN